ncbi:MAG: DUF4393 domain-containing protein [Oscillospiraceae bacterium]|nr:DUF4393 domain-containing protein [Oscillospiraceae bacterium]
MLDLKPFEQPLNELSTPLAKSAGKTLQDIWDLVFGGFGTFVDKKRSKREKDLIDFKRSLENEVNQIPVKNIKEPTLSIIGPALEASKYYYEEPELRNMFAKLVAGSMDDRQKIHPCFIEIIKQLSPHDAKLLTLFSENPNRPICNVLEYDNSKKDSYLINKPNVFVSNEFPDIEANQLSLTSLDRAALIKLNFVETIHEKEAYNDLINACNIDRLNKRIGWDKYEIVKGAAILTPLGHSFISVCL